MTAVTRPTLSEIKTQCRIDHNYDDDYLSQLENSAFNLMNTYLNRTIITDSNAELSDNDIMYNDQLKIAELMIIDSFYNDRSAEKIPGAAMFILNQFQDSASVMESGKLNERITIKSHDGLTSYDVWCNVRPVTTREQLRNSTVLANNLLTLQIRYLKDINNTFKVVYQGYEYDIVNITSDWKADSIILTVIMNDDSARIRNT